MDATIVTDPTATHLLELLDLAIKVLILAFLAAALRRGGATKAVLIAAALAAAGCGHAFTLANKTNVGPLGVGFQLDLTAAADPAAAEPAPFSPDTGAGTQP